MKKSDQMQAQLNALYTQAERCRGGDRYNLIMDQADDLHLAILLQINAEEAEDYAEGCEEDPF